jgi:bla regulator protein blaR1
MVHEVLNHLWQSTVFAAAVGLLTLAFRKNGAHVRYGLWLAASCKFLIPFSVLGELGSRLSWRTAPAAKVPLALDNFVQPFRAPGATAAVARVAAAPMSAPHAAAVNWAVIAVGLWAAGTLAVAIWWFVRWLRLRSIVRHATPLEIGAPIPARSATASIEPGVFGLFRPVLLLPEGIRERLTPGQMAAIVAHEMCHVRRRDNLTAAIHMVVEAMFWFHPLVWWIGARMIAEREAACDEAVISDGGDREAYAEALLTVCKFYVESPLASAAGVAGADLKKRIERIMTQRMTRKLGAVKKLALATLAALTMVGPVATASFFAAPPRAMAQATAANVTAFQSVTIQQSQPDVVEHRLMVGVETFRMENTSLRKVIGWAFDTQSELVTGPDTLDMKYDIEAKAPEPFPLGDGHDIGSGSRGVVRNMLADQFQLQTHRGTQSISDAYVLTAGPGNTLLKAALRDGPGQLVNIGPTSISGANLPMHLFVDALSEITGHAVIDQTGMIENYQFNVDWGRGANINGTAVPFAKPSPEELAKALQSQEGLTLQLATVPVEVLVVDHVASPKTLVAAKTAMPMEPAAFDAYAGYYLFSGALVHLYREGDRYFSLPPGQQPVEIFPEANGEFFAKVKNASVSFDKDATGRVTGLVLHESGRDTAMPRVDEATAKQMMDAATARAQLKTARPGSEEALRKTIADMAAGTPDHNAMMADLSATVKEQQPVMERVFQNLGALTELKFMGIDPQDADTYRADFEHGAMECHIIVTPEGKISWLVFKPAGSDN